MVHQLHTYTHTPLSICTCMHAHMHVDVHTQMHGYISDTFTHTCNQHMHSIILFPDTVFLCERFFELNKTKKIHTFVNIRIQKTNYTIHPCVHAQMHKHINALSHTQAHTGTHRHTQARTGIHRHTQMYTGTHWHKHTGTNTQAHTGTHTRTHIHTRSNTGTHTQVQARGKKYIYIYLLNNPCYTYVNDYHIHSESFEYDNLFLHFSF